VKYPVCCEDHRIQIMKKLSDQPRQNPK